MFPLYLIRDFMIRNKRNVRFLLTFIRFNRRLLILRTTRLLRINMRKVRNVSKSTAMEMKIYPNVHRNDIISKRGLRHLLVNNGYPIGRTLRITRVTCARTFLKTRKRCKCNCSKAFPYEGVRMCVAITSDRHFINNCLQINRVTIKVILPNRNATLFLIMGSRFVLRQRTSFTNVRFCLPFKRISITRGNDFIQIPIARHLLISTRYRTVIAICTKNMHLCRRPLFMTFQNNATFTVHRRKFYRDKYVGVLLLKRVLPAVFCTMGFLQVIYGIRST